MEKKSNASKWIKILVLVAIVCIIYFLIPCPEGLQAVDETTGLPTGKPGTAWKLLSVYVAMIIGLILRPISEGALLLVGIAVTGLVFGVTTPLAGYGNSSTWLVFGAFMVGTAFSVSGLGKRIAYILLKAFGNSVLGLCYVECLTDLAISPATSSNTARSGGIVMPVFENVCEALGSQKGTPSAKKLGSYIIYTLYPISLGTSVVFLTACAAHPVAVELAGEILGLSFTWGRWFVCLCVPSLLLLAIYPIFMYIIFPPEVKKIEGKKIARERLAEMGPMTKQETTLLILFLLAILGWATGDLTGISATTVAVSFFAFSVLFGVCDWKDIENTRGGWSCLMWYGGIIGFANALSSAGFFSWLAAQFGVIFETTFIGMSPWLAMLILIVVNVVAHYVFSSTAAYVSSMFPTLFAIAAAANLPGEVTVYAMASAALYGSVVTQYSNASGPVIFAGGWATQGQFWKYGAINAVLSIAVYMTVGWAWWGILGLL